MKFIKAIFAHMHSRIWFIVTVVMVAVLIVANIMAGIYGGVISLALGGDRAIEVDDAEAQTYYEPETTSKDDATEKGFALTQRVSEEGTIMLKNNGTLPFAGTGLKVSVFGKNSVNLVYGGSGSGGGDTTFAKKTIFDSLTEAGFEYNDRLKTFYENNSESGAPRDESPALSTGSDAQEPMSTGETPIDNYNAHGIPETYDEYSDAAIVVLSRLAGESYDLPKKRSEERDQKHYLALDKHERALIAHVTENFDNVIVVLNTLNVIEAGELEDNEKIDSILWIGGPGSTGIMALGKILNGSVTPSGRTVDTWASDFTKDPTWNNFSEAVDGSGNYISNSGRYTQNSRLTDESFVRYEENIYIGYRYYETRAYEERQSSGNNSWYEENVVYPFGYGLSYSAFTYGGLHLKADGMALEVCYELENTSERDGKEVSQVYVRECAPLVYRPEAGRDARGGGSVPLHVAAHGVVHVGQPLGHGAQVVGGCHQQGGKLGGGACHHVGHVVRLGGAVGGEQGGHLGELAPRGEVGQVAGVLGEVEGVVARHLRQLVRGYLHLVGLQAAHHGGHVGAVALGGHGGYGAVNGAVHRVVEAILGEDAAARGKRVPLAHERAEHQTLDFGVVDEWLVHDATSTILPGRR